MVINNFSAIFFEIHVGQINLGTLGVAIRSPCSSLSRSSMPLSSSIWDKLSASLLSSLAFGLAQSTFQSRHVSESEMLWGVLSSTISAGWRSILLILRPFKTWVHSTGRCFADKAGGKDDLSDNINAATPSCWKFDQDALTISSVSEMYPTAVIDLFWARDSFCIACWFWLPCHYSKRSWSFAILGNFHASSCLLISRSFSVFIVFGTALSPTNISLLARAKCLTNPFPQRVSPLVLDCLQSITSHPRETLAPTPTRCGKIENM